MTAITHETPFLTEDQPHRFSCDASDIGFGPGEWPAAIECSLGNKLPLHLQALIRDADGDVSFAEYRQALGIVTVKIFND